MTSKVWDKQHGGSHYQKYKIHYKTSWQGKETRFIESNTFYRNDYRERL